MLHRNARLAAVVASVAVGAVALGGVLAYRQSPRADNTAAGPLTTRKPTTARPTYTGPVNVTVRLAALKRGRAPQIPYLVQREVRGGAGTPVRLRGAAPVLEFARIGEEALAVLSLSSDRSILVRRKADGHEERVADVISIRSTADQAAAAYTTQPRAKDGTGNVRGGIVFAQQSDGRVDKVAVPELWYPRVLAYIGGTVYFQAGLTEDVSFWKLFSWRPGAAQVTEIPTPGSPTAVSPDGKLVALQAAIGEYGACSTVNELATGRSLWRTCDHRIVGFTPDSTVAIAEPPYRDGWAPPRLAALDVRTGNTLRQWTGAMFISTVPEDDQHLLMVADDGENSPRGIIRCLLTTGACEQAVPLGTHRLDLGR